MKLEWHLMSEAQPEMIDGSSGHLGPILIQFYRFGRNRSPEGHSSIDYAVGERHKFKGEVYWCVDGGERYPPDADVHAWAVLEKLNPD